MFQRVREHMIRGWMWFKYEERGAQTLEWLALALLILGILGAGSVAVNDGKFVQELKDKFVDMVGNINKPK